MSLTSTAITQDAVMTAGKALLKEYLTGYFDGASHSLGPSAQVFPDLRGDKGIVFDIDEANMPDSASGSFQQIRLILSPIRARVFHTDEPPPAGQTQLRMAFDDVRIQAFLTAKAADWRTSNMQVNTLADLLFAVLKLHNLTAVLAEKGVCHVRPRIAGLVASDRAPMRMLQATAQFYYPVVWAS